MFDSNYGFEYQMPIHQYYLYVSGLKNVKPKTFDSRVSAESYMMRMCAKYGISVECTEFDKHERKYSNHNGVRFYINRI